MVLLLLVVLFNWRNRKLRQKKKILERMVRQRTKKIAQQNHELEKLSIVARETDNGVLIMDPAGKVLWVNEGFSRLYGYSLKQLLNELGDSIFKISKKSNFKTIFDQCLQKRESVRFESSNKTRLGKDIWIQTTLTPILNKNGTVSKLIAIDSDISKLNRAYEKMKEMSLTDLLTRLRNRRYFHNLIDREVQLSLRSYSRNIAQGLIFPMIFLMIDIDHFKEVNDVYGHKVGDQLLVDLSSRISTTLRSSDLLVRWGGEEFLIMLKDDNLDGTKLLTKRLLEVVSLKEFDLGGIRIKKTISIGYCGFPVNHHEGTLFSWEEIVHLADSALYIAKNSGRNRAVGIKMMSNKLSKKNRDDIKNHFHQALNEKTIEIITTKGNY
jgi:diguanylate cyclase (GGDEF)-like protein/PAS domain S-box-containing protein